MTLLRDWFYCLMAPHSATLHEARLSMAAGRSKWAKRSVENCLFCGMWKVVLK